MLALKRDTEWNILVKAATHMKVVSSMVARRALEFIALQTTRHMKGTTKRASGVALGFFACLMDVLWWAISTTISCKDNFCFGVRLVSLGALRATW